EDGGEDAALAVRLARVVEQELAPAREIDAQALEEAESVGRERAHDLGQRQALRLAVGGPELELVARVLASEALDLRVQARELAGELALQRHEALVLGAPLG